MRLFLISLLAAFGSTLTGCDTISTVTKDDDYIKYSLKSYRTNCYSIPRIYSGVGYDVCKANSSTTDFSKQLAEMFYWADTLPSAIVDTVILPYSIYKQNKDGSIAIDEHQ